MPSSSTRRKLRFLTAYALSFGMVWLLWDTALVYPLKIFVVFLHEVSHGLVAMATGGWIDWIVLDPMQGGACHCPSPNAFATLSAGYLGSLLWGVGMMEAARSRRVRASLVNALLGGMVVLVTALYVRSGFGLAFGALFGAGLLAVARWVEPGANRILLTTLGMTSALYAILDIKSDVLDRPELRSDAVMLGELTGVPGVVWGVAWTVVALLVVGWSLRRGWREA